MPRTVRLIALTTFALASVLAFGEVSTSAAPSWAPVGSATIRPGVQTDTQGAQCTANFVFTDGTNVYIGQAAHCSGTGGATETDGCLAGSLPLGTPVTVGGASQPGTLVYNSWITMQQEGETDPDTCAFNDFALVRLAPADAAKVNPTVPHWGGPVALSSTGTTAGARVYSYGNSSLRQGIAALSPKTGISLGDAGNGWSHNVFTLTPGVPGDSGSAFLDASGRALGVLSTLQIAPVTGSNGVGNLAKELAYMHAHTTIGAQLAPGTEPFTPNKLPLGI